MRNTLRILSVAAALGALAPLAAHADMYQPSPVIVHTQPQHHARTALNSQAPTANNGTVNNGQASNAQHNG